MTRGARGMRAGGVKACAVTMNAMAVDTSPRMNTQKRRIVTREWTRRWCRMRRTRLGVRRSSSEPPPPPPPPVPSDAEETERSESRRVSGMKSTMVTSSSASTSASSEAIAGAKRSFSVPWGVGTLLIGCTALTASFVLVGVVTAGVYVRLNSEMDQISLSPGFVLVEELLQLSVGASVLAVVLRKHRDVIDADNSDLFVLDPRKTGWLRPALVHLVIGLLSVYVVSFVLREVGWTDAQTGRGTADEMGSLLLNDGSGGAELLVLPVLLTAVAIGAPLFEELVFRGFLLTSLNKYMRDEFAIAISAAVFALVHASTRDAPEVFVMGVVLGSSYTRTKHLLTPVTVHALFNGGTLLLIAALGMMGYSADDVLSTTASSSDVVALLPMPHLADVSAML